LTDDRTGPNNYPDGSGGVGDPGQRYGGKKKKSLSKLPLNGTDELSSGRVAPEEIKVNMRVSERNKFSNDHSH
jgi:hypothetical protein